MQRNYSSIRLKPTTKEKKNAWKLQKILSQEQLVKFEGINKRKKLIDGNY